MGKKHMSSRLLISLTLTAAFSAAACKASSISLPKPTAKTVYVSAVTNGGTGALEAVDLGSRTVNDVLPADVFSPYAAVKTYANNLYIVSAEPANVLVLEPDNNYTPACAAETITACQFALPATFDIVDFVVVDAKHMYLTTDLSTEPASAPGSLSNFVHIYDPTTGVESGAIDVAAGAKALPASAGGEDLLAVVGDGTLDLGAMYQVDDNLFVVAQMLVTGTPPPDSFFTPRAPKATTDACGYEPSRVIVIDLKSNTVKHVIKLRGANTQGPFVVEPNTNNLLLSSPGATATFSQEPCNGIERVDTQGMVSKGAALTEAQLSLGVKDAGTVFSFDIDNLGKGYAFVGSGTSDKPDYSLVHFNLKTAAVTQVADEGVKGISYYGTVIIDAQRQAYISLPYGTTPVIATYDVESNTLVSTITLKLGAFSMAFYPGPAFIKL